MIDNVSADQITAIITVQFKVDLPSGVLADNAQYQTAQLSHNYNSLML